jgi:outer membrane protein TolC
VTVTANFAATGQGRQADADRAASESQLLRAEGQRAEEAAAVAAAELAELLSTDPTTRVRPTDEFLAPVELVPPGARLEDLVRVAELNRPEVAARTATVAVTQIRLRQERVRPFVPLLWVGYSAGGFGGGSDQTDPRFGRFDGRTDLDVLAVWSLENAGLGNVAVQRQRRAEVRQALAGRVREIDRVRREVADAYALAAARLREMEAARRRVAAATEGSRLDLIRTRNLEGRPIEVLNSLTTLAAARQELIQAVTGYNLAQFQLFVALGRPPTLAVPDFTACPAGTPPDSTTAVSRETEPLSDPSK